MKYHYNHVCLGGTFDHLHAGHKRILEFAFHSGQYVSIGVTTDQFIQRKFLSSSIQPFEQRLSQLTDYLKQNNWDTRASMFPLEDIYGIAATADNIQAIVVTKETNANAQKINIRRISKKLPPLDILMVPFLKGQDRKIVRAERIRKGIINRNGKSYLQLFAKNKPLYLPTALRRQLREPLGTIIEGTERNSTDTAKKALQTIEKHRPVLTVLVGDIVTDSLLAIGFEPEVIIRDFRSRRKELPQEKILAGAINNPPGTIQPAAVKAVFDAISIIQPKLKEIIIQGEEDLLALPAILLSPLNSMIVYGQADKGIILTPVTEEKKEQIAEILQQFD